ncbi:MAG: TIGR03364 family FAD-dependent oxidoreductase [Chlorobia bacterium]|nr:TIGR03364 family FAD-dependent oxidoreductase [Fimbriimonadaceae bacterium]
MMKRWDAIVVGAGIIGLTTAYHLAKTGKKVLVLEREERSIGASVRNLGMIWPIGQPIGPMRDIALRSRDLWLEVLRDAGIWFERCGSLHLAYHEDELQVLQEFVSQVPNGSETPVIVDASEAGKLSTAIRREGLLGAMYSASELSVDPRTTVHQLTRYLAESLGVEFRFGESVRSVEPGVVATSNSYYEASEIFLCLGPTVGDLYPDLIWGRGTRLCKLQMLRARPKHLDYRIGTHLCAGLTLLHYSNFAKCRSLHLVKDRLNLQWPNQIAHHIHLLVAQHADGTLTIGDSHEYGFSFSPYSDEQVDQYILDYLDTFLATRDLEIVQRWQGYYPKHEKESFLIERPESGVTVINVLTGIGMTISFGLTELAIGTELLA